MDELFHNTKNKIGRNNIQIGKTLFKFFNFLNAPANKISLNFHTMAFTRIKKVYLFNFYPLL